MVLSGPPLLLASPPLSANPSVLPFTIAVTNAKGSAVAFGGVPPPGVLHPHSPFSRSASTQGPSAPPPHHPPPLKKKKEKLKR